MKEIKMMPIGFVSSQVVNQTDEDWGRVVSRINLQREFAGAIKGLKDFSHAIVLTFLHQAEYKRDKHLQRRPQGLETMPIVGIFAQRAKDRPNPIGVTAVEIIRIDETYLDVKGLDAIDGTPVLDIKPYFPQFDRIENPIVPGWVNVLMENYF